MGAGALSVGVDLTMRTTAIDGQFEHEAGAPVGHRLGADLAIVRVQDAAAQAQAQAYDCKYVSAHRW